jgi:hypothetical protein
VRKRFVLAALLAGLALFAAPSAVGSRHLLGGIFDEPQTLGNPDWAFPQYTSLGVDVIRVNLYWGGASGVARRRRPVNAINPADAAYDWALYDSTVKRAAAARIKVVFSILWTPGWAGPRANRAPRKMIDLRNFAFAAAKRYSGSFRPMPDAAPLPPVRFWMAWNEPNNPVFLQPQFVRSGKGFRAWSPRVYAQMCNSVWSGVHLTGFSGEKVACGVTAPRGNNSGLQPRASISPIYFLRGMKRAGAHFDVYAHHPYSGHPNETPRTPPPGGRNVRAVTLGNISVLINELTRLYGRKQLWITEYGYQTNPPDRFFGVSWAKQARYLAQAYAIARANPRIDMMCWFLIKDDRRAAGWQSGFYTVSGRRKPAWSAFQRVFR